MSFITGAIGFILGLGIIITIHELGHYWVARLGNVKILSFSIGFGKPIYQWIRGKDKTRYIIAAFPLGGYVSMMGSTEGEIEEGQADRAFCRQPLWLRSAIVVAGPLANFLLAIVLFATTYLVGFQEIKPIVGGVAQSSIAMRAGLQSNDEIVAVNGVKTSQWKSTSLMIAQRILEQQPVRLGILRNQQPQTLLLNADITILEGEESILDALGIMPLAFTFPAIIDTIISDSSAERAGLQAQDEIIAFNQIPINDWRSLVDQIVANPNRTVRLKIKRNDAILTVPITLDAIDQQGKTVGRAGIAPYVDREAMSKHIQYVSYPLHQALAKGVVETMRMTQLTLTFLWNMISGNMSLKNINGPVTIAEVTGASFNLGFIAYFITLALISISIGILNLLPIPMLDGGHLFYYAIEFIKRSPVSERSQALGQRVGIGMLAILMTIAFYNDMVRLFL